MCAINTASLASFALLICLGSAAPTKFLIVSAPRTGKVGYQKIGHGGFLGNMKPLISEGLVHPQGLAIDQRGGRLLIADPDSRHVLSYSLTASRGALSATRADAAMKDVEARWVAVDGLGNVYASDEPSNRILKVTAEQMRNGDANPSVLYDGLSLMSVSGPGGIAVDNYYTFWVNKQIGTQVGSLMRGAVAPDQKSLATSVQALAKNTDKSYGLCAALGNVYYTQPEGSIFAVRKDGDSTVQTVTHDLSRPRGCAWDGDGTVYVADRGANAVYSFAGNMPSLGTALLQKAADFEDAFGVAVYSGATRRSDFGAAVLGLLAWRLAC